MRKIKGDKSVTFNHKILNDLMQKTKTTQLEISYYCETASSHVSRICKGDVPNPNVKFLFLLSELFGVRMEIFILSSNLN